MMKETIAIIAAAALAGILIWRIAAAQRETRRMMGRVRQQSVRWIA